MRSAAYKGGSIENSISFVELGRLLEACVAATRCEHLGLLVGQRSGTSSLGLVGRLMQTAPTLKDAILDLCTNQRRYVRGSVAYLVIQNEIAFWGYAVHYPEVRAIEQISDGAIAVGFNMMRELVGAAPEEVLTSRRPPGNIEPYRRFFGSAPRFDAEQHALAFPTSLLSRPIRSANRQLRRILEESVAAYWAIEQPSITDAVTRMLRARVIFPDISLEAVASELSVQPRTLNRRLQAEGKSFRELVNQARFEVARQLLAGTRMDRYRSRARLRRTERLTHAFQRWSGVAPSEWRTN
jgi:AraC-like DNA-binding protein